MSAGGKGLTRQFIKLVDVPKLIIKLQRAITLSKNVEPHNEAFSPQIVSLIPRLQLPSNKSGYVKYQRTMSLSKLKKICTSPLGTAAYHKVALN